MEDDDRQKPELPSVPSNPSGDWVRIIDDRLRNIESIVGDQQSRLARIEGRLNAISVAITRRLFDGVAVGGLGVSITLGALLDFLNRTNVALPAPRRHRPRCDIALIPGTANTALWVRGVGAVSEPSVVAYQSMKGVDKVIAVGEEALAKERNDGIKLVWPIRDGVIADVAAAQHLLEELLYKTQFGRTYRRRHVAVTVPVTATNAEQEILYQTVTAAGASRVYFIEAPLAAAIGADMPVTEPIGSMVVVMGAGCTEVAVISMRGIAYTTSVRVGGKKMDQAIAAYIRRNYNLLIADRTAERIKTQIGSAVRPPDGAGLTVHIRGRDLITGTAKEIQMHESHVHEALSECLTMIVDAVRATLDVVAPELAADIVEQGIVLTGGGALLGGMTELLGKETGLPVAVSDDPMQCCVLGAAFALDEPSMDPLLVEYSRR